MVERLAVAAQNLHGSVRLAGGPKENVLKKTLLHMVRTGTGEEEGVRPHLRHRIAVHILVGAERVRDVAPFLHERGWIEND